MALAYARVVSFLVDPPLLVASGEAYARLAPEEAQGGLARAAAAACLALFWGVSGPLYLNARWTRPLWRLLPGRDGCDWIIRSGVLPVRPPRRDARLDAVVVALFATYPLWLWLGWDHGRRARPRPPGR
ncbi:MAG TPA: hypothetical protein VF520_17165 [Thermoleophilaceae bacterium]|jgi:hypothetical protein